MQTSSRSEQFVAAKGTHGPYLCLRAAVSLRAEVALARSLEACPTRRARSGQSFCRRSCQADGGAGKAEGNNAKACNMKMVSFQFGSV